MLAEPGATPGVRWREVLAWLSEEIAWFATLFVAAVGVAHAADALGASSEAGALFAFHAGLLAYAAVRERSKLAAWFRPTRAAVTWGVGTGVAMTATGALYGAALRAAGVEIPDVVDLLRAIVPNPVVLIGWGAVFVPIAEELYFRGRLIDAGGQRLGTGAAVALAALAFALVHGVPVLIPAYLAFGWLLWKARDRSGGLLAPVLAHAINNVLGLTVPGP